MSYLRSQSAFVRIWEETTRENRTETTKETPITEGVLPVPKEFLELTYRKIPDFEPSTQFLMQRRHIRRYFRQCRNLL